MPKAATMKPLIFGPRSILAWQQHAKSQTRRLVRPQPAEGLSIIQSEEGVWVAQDETLFELVEQPYAVGDVLWIREALRRFREPPDLGNGSFAVYDIDGRVPSPDGPQCEWTWKRDKLPAMFMPRWACRYYAKVASVRAERLRDMSHADGVAEGTLVGLTFKNFAPTATWYPGKTRQLYLEWWDSLHRKPGTRSRDNPWVWVYGLEALDAKTE